LKVFIDPYYFRWCLPKELIWEVPVKDKSLFLTFDDGPTGDLTNKILKLLNEFNINATFFCVGENVKKRPQLYKEILDRGHAVGNHSHNHMNGWKYSFGDYVENVRQCSEYVSSSLFRPPHGKITIKQYNVLKESFKIIMWSALTRDWDNSVSLDKCLQIARKGLKPGAIHIFHDNVKAEERIEKVLPVFINEALEQGYAFRTL